MVDQRERVHLHCEHYLGIRKINLMLNSAEGISHDGKQHEHRLTLIPQSKLCQNHFELSPNHDNTKLHSWIAHFRPKERHLNSPHEQLYTWDMKLLHQNCCKIQPPEKEQHVHELQITIFYFSQFSDITFFLFLVCCLLMWLHFLAFIIVSNMNSSLVFFFFILSHELSNKFQLLLQLPPSPPHCTPHSHLPTFSFSLVFMC